MKLKIGCEGTVMAARNLVYPGRYNKAESSQTGIRFHEAKMMGNKNILGMNFSNNWTFFI